MCSPSISIGGGAKKARGTRGILPVIVLVLVLMALGSNLYMTGGVKQILEFYTLKCDLQSSPSSSYFPDNVALPVLQPVNIIFALCGNHPGFFGEFKVALKSVLLNAPHHRDTHIHLLVDQLAYNYLPEVWKEIEIDGVEWWRNITIVPYNVEPKFDEWIQILKPASGLGGGSRHTFGTYFRLFAHTVLPSDVEYAFYLDTDVVVVANLAHLFDNAPVDTPDKPSPMFLMATENAGIMLVNVKKLDQFWAQVSAIKSKFNKKRLQDADQSLVLNVGVEYPGTVENIPAAWDFVLTEHINKARNVDRLVKFRPELAIAHYNGGSGSKGSYFNDKFVNKYPQAGGLPALFFRDLPWQWAKFMGKSVGGAENTGIRIQDTIFNLTKRIEKIPPKVKTGDFKIPDYLNSYPTQHVRNESETEQKERGAETRFDTNDENEELAEGTTEQTVKPENNTSEKNDNTTEKNEVQMAVNAENEEREVAYGATKKWKRQNKRMKPRNAPEVDTDKGQGDKTDSEAAKEENK